VLLFWLRNRFYIHILSRSFLSMTVLNLFPPIFNFWLWDLQTVTTKKVLTFNKERCVENGIIVVCNSK
jgi:hypothetical protein